MSEYKDLNLVVPISKDNISIKKDEEKCIKCGFCRNVCNNEITVGRMYELDKSIEPICINCGQCANLCPTEAIKERLEYIKAKEAIKDPNKVVIISTAPAVRVGLGEEFGIQEGSFVESKMVGALKELGADYVLDITFGADLTIMEEAAELVERIKQNKNLPQFTSCCPAWVKYAEIFYPELLPHLSTAKSPISMQGATIKTYFAKKMNIDPKNIVNIVVAPCTAKKYEIRRPEMNSSAKYNNIENLRDNDYVITTRELAKWIKEEKIDFEKVEEKKFDSLLGTGAGVIFGNTGGVTEAALRTAYQFQETRGMKGIKEATIDFDGIEIKVAIANGMKNAKELIDKILNKEVTYHFIEVMNCSGGCINGGGQPKMTMLKMQDTKRKRIDSLYLRDRNMKKRLSYKNPEIIEVYKNFYENPLSELAEDLLHTKYEDKSYLLNISKEDNNGKNR